MPTVYNSPNHNLPCIDFNGERRILAKLPPEKDSGIPLFKASPYYQGGIPKSEWREISNRTATKVLGIYNQGGHGSCVGQGATRALMSARLASGFDDPGNHVQLSPTFTYSLINGNQDRGAIISHAIKALRDVGTCPFDLCGQGTIYQYEISPAAKAEAGRFRFDEVYQSDDPEEWIQGLQLGFFVVYGMQVGDNFNNFDQNGVAGWSRGPGNHCMMADGWKRLSNGTPAFDNVNSWGTEFGDNGRCLLVPKHFETAQPDAFLVRTVTADPEDTNPPPDLKS